MIQKDKEYLKWQFNKYIEDLPHEIQSYFEI